MAADMLFFSPPWTIKFLPSTLIATTLAFSYWYWVELCFKHNGFYPYPIFGVLSVPARVGLFFGSALVMAANTMLLKWIYSTINGTSSKNEKPGALKGE